MVSSSCLIDFHYHCTVNPLYNDIRYNSKIRYNVDLVYTKISGSCFLLLLFFFIVIPILFLRKTYVLCICKNRLTEAILTKTQNVSFIKTVRKYPLFMI